MCVDPLILCYSKSCLLETPQYLRESVPTWRVSLQHRFLKMGQIGHRSEKLSPDHRVSPHRSVPWRQVLLYNLWAAVYNVTMQRWHHNYNWLKIHTGNNTQILICESWSTIKTKGNLFLGSQKQHKVYIQQTSLITNYRSVIKLLGHLTMELFFINERRDIQTLVNMAQMKWKDHSLLSNGQTLIFCWYMCSNWGVYMYWCVARTGLYLSVDIMLLVWTCCSRIVECRSIFRREGWTCALRSGMFRRRKM